MAQPVVVITGASSGIGAALAEHLSGRGMPVVLVARRKDVLAEVAARCDGRAHAIVADVTQRGDVRRAVEEALAAFGRIDVWINNAGRGITRMPSQLSDADIDEMMSSNVKSALYGIQEVLPHFQSRGTGHIINVSSMLGRVPFATIRSAYCGAKHFLNALTATLRDELKQSHPGIQVSLVSPGVVRTDFGLNAMHGGPDSRTFPESQSAEEVAAVIAGVIDSRLPDVYTRTGAQAMIASYYAKAGVDPGL
jgi:NADP-dependent 3-hydroxy acid dehydrogenase YdfG